MAETEKLTTRNQKIAELFTDEEKLKSFYRFVSQNPHINLRDACQILILRPDATVCFSYEEWSAVGRQVKRGARGIAYYDYDGYRQFVYDATDTRGTNRAFRPIIPVEKLLSGLDEINGTDFADSEGSDFQKIQDSVHFYLHEQAALTGNEERDWLTVEGVAFSLYAQTEFPQFDEIALRALPYSFSDNATFVKEIYVQAAALVQEIEDAYRNNQAQVEMIDDTDEETVSDEPIITAEAVATEEPKATISETQNKPTPTEPQSFTVSSFYQRYLDAQKLNPQAVVVIRCGDFYEIMGENAKVVAQELDLTLTGRNVGLPDRVPMCGMPYHAMDKYLDKILANHGVILVDDEEEPKYILSHAEARAEQKGKEQKPIPAGIPDDEPNPFDEPQEQEDDWRDELADELTDMEVPEGLKWNTGTDYEEPVKEKDEQDEDSFEGDEEKEDDDSSTDATEEISGKPKKVKSVPKKTEKGIKDRKRKAKSQISLWDIAAPQEQSREEKFIEYELKRGSHVQDGKYRIFDKYNENPSEKAFADFLKKEYGIGGSYVGNTDETHDAKGIRLRWKEKEHPENNLDILLKWNEVAVRIADLIDEDKYFSDKEKEQYVEYRAEQQRLREQQAEEARQKKELINQVIVSADSERKQRILDEYAKTTVLTDFAEFLKNEYETSTERGEGYSAVYNAQGIWISRGENVHDDYLNRIYLNWNEFADKVCSLIENDRYIEPPIPQETDDEVKEKIKAIADRIVKEGTEGTTQGNWITLYEDFKEDEPFVRNHRDEIADELESREEVSDVMIALDGFDTNFYTDYCPNHEEDEVFEVSKEPFSRFKNLTVVERVFFDEYSRKSIYEPRFSPWGEVQDCRTIANGIYEVSTAGHGGVMISTELTPHILSYEARQEGFQENGYYCFEEDCDASIPLRELYDKGILNKGNDYFTHYYVKSNRAEAERGSVPFHKATETEKGNFFTWWNQCIDDSLVRWHPEYWEVRKKADMPRVEESANTDLSGVLDQSELGGAKTRFKNNVAAIRLVNNLYAENRSATDAEKKVLAQFVGWGGLSQAFDENNPQWRKEYAELKGLLSQEDYEQARSSTLNAYYTSKEVIGGIYQALARFGVKGNNRILEPSMGTGNFFGFMPQEIASGARLYGVELDNLTGRIAAKLYPQANVQIKGFEDTSFPNDKFDVVVGNVPFGGYGIADSDYNRYNFKVHDYFLAKSIDKVKPNGIVAIVTSKGTMDKLNPSARRYVAERAELLGAIRLPNTAFKQTAGTEAVADILFFRKRTERINLAEENIAWLGLYKTAEGYVINNYFADNPEMVLGTLAEETGLYGGVDVTVKSDGRDLSEALAEAVKNLPQGIYLNPEQSPEEERVTEVDYSVKPMCYKAENGRLYMRVGEEMVEQRIPSYPKDAYQRIQAMIALREELHHILDIQIQGCTDETLQEEQRKLNALYDRFVRQYGNLNSQTNTRLFKDDGDSALLFACEEVNEETQAVKKADIFYKRTIRPYTVPTNTDDCFEALQISKNERGRVDIEYIEELTGKDYDTVVEELGNAVFRDPELIKEEDEYSAFVTAEEYLSGKVVAKLGIAQRYAEEHPAFQKNVDALIQVQPEPIPASDISVRLGQTWVGKEIYKQFYLELISAYWYMKSDVELYYNPHDSSWRIDQKDNVRRDTRMKQTEVYGTKRAPAYRLFVDCLNGRDTSVYDTIEENGKTKSVLNQAETIAAREKQNKIREEFRNWIFADPERRESLERKYNAIFNQTRLPSYDGSYLRFPAMNPAIELNPHQKNAVHRIITSDESTLLHHVVGSGKTFTIIASIMKMRQLGLCQKAMVTVPNHLVEQWAGEWRKLYPNANILVATKEDLEKDNRQKFVSKVALGDWDGIIIAQSAFAKIPISKDRQIRKLNEEIEMVRLTLEKRKEDRMSGGSVKNLERIIKNKEKQLKNLMSGEKKDGVLIFENLGVDYLYVDEAHYYKNLFLFTKMNNVAGISNAASQRASDLKLKCEYLQELHDSDKGVVFATGTPISNSMTEMYTMQTYLQPTELRDHGITFFDGWAADFGETVTSMELSPSGQGYRTRTRFSKFTNLPELQKMYRSFADVITSDMVKLDVPEAERRVITLKPSDTVIELAQQIAERADRIYGGGVDPHEDNMLKVTSDGKKLALDPRCFVPDAADEQGSKLNAAAQRIHEIWENTVDIKGTQIVFCDLSTPKKRFEEYVYGEDFDAYNELKYKLVQKGIPAEEIAYIHDAATDEQKQALFDKVNSGAVRVLIGSTEKCGAGTNVQKRLIALHHLDTPYRPSDMEQREGRIIRQGNTNKQVQIYTYVMERTFDSYSYQILENKQRFISQICKGDFTAREYEDVDATTLSYAEIKAITAANPRIKRKMEVDTEINRLRVLEGQYKKNLFALQDKIRKEFPEEIRKQELLIGRITEDLQMVNDNRPVPDTFRISVNGVEYTEKKEGGLALMDAINSKRLYETIAEYRGFKISIDARSVILGEDRDIILTATGQYGVSVGESANGTITRLDNLIEDLPARKERLEKRLVQMKSDLAIAEEQVKKPFEHTEVLSELLKEQAELNAELNLDKREAVILDDGNGGEEEGNFMGVPIDKKSIMEVDIIDEKKENAQEQGVIDYQTAVKKSVVQEYEEFKSDLTQRGGDVVFQENYKISAYNTFLNLIEDSLSFSEADYKAMSEERGHILSSLYDEFLKMDGGDINDYDEMLDFIKGYCRRFHGEFYYKEMPIYLRTFAYAYEHDEVEEYRKSHEINEECRRAIDEAIRENFDGMNLKGGFEDQLIEKYGMDRVAFIVATTINEHEWDGRYSHDNNEWAKSVPMSESEDERSDCCLNIHPAVLDGFTNMIREKIKEKNQEEQTTMAQERQEEEEKYLKVTPQGHKVLSIIKDGFNRNIAILHRELIGDFVVAARYNPKDGKWAQGTYDFQTVEEAEAYREEHYGKNAENAVIEDIKPARNWLYAHVAREALIAKHDYSSFFRMPNTGEYAGYGYSIYNNRIKNSRQLVDLQSDTRELCYDIRVAEDETVKLTRANGDEITLTAREFMDFVSGTTSKDYEEKPRIEVNIPSEAKGDVYDNSTRFTLPNSVSSERYTYFVPNRFIAEGEGENEGRIILSIPEDFTIKAQNFDGDQMEYDVKSFYDLCNGTDETDYYFEGDEETEADDKKRWFYVTVHNAARVAQMDNSTLFKMPKGEYEGYTFFIPTGFLKEDDEKGTIRIGLPEDFIVKPKNNITGDEINLSAEAFSAQVRNKRVFAYNYYQRPSEEAQKQFALREKMLRENIPPEMQERDNWIAIATFEKENGKLGKRPIDCNTGKYAEADNPATWTSFDKACKFARENGCVTIGYALDGKDNIACIDLDHCVEENGDYSELACKTFALSEGTYCERSVSGQGLHVFGKTDGMDLRSFSKDGDMEFYRDSRFIAMTGDYFVGKELKSFDTSEMKSLLESKFAKRETITNGGKGTEGLSRLDDREVYEKACSAYNGDKFKALYEGQDLKNDHSRSDMALMSSLAFWCNGDKEQMIRIFSTSGLYRRSKSPSYYECTAIKAIETINDRYAPKPKAEHKKPTSGNSSGGNGKR